MKNTAGRRAVLILFWLVSVLMFATVVLSWAWPDFMPLVFHVLDGYVRHAFIGFCVLYVLLSACVMVFCLRKPAVMQDKGFVTLDSSENGNVRMSIPAIEQMVAQAARTVDGMRDMRSNIVNTDEGVDILVDTTIENGFNVPSVSLSLQRVIRQYVEMHCGVQVHAVVISILSVTRPVDTEKKLPGPLAEKRETVSAPEPSQTPQPAFQEDDGQAEEAAEPVDEDPIHKITLEKEQDLTES